MCLFIFFTLIIDADGVGRVELASIVVVDADVDAVGHRAVDSSGELKLWSMSMGIIVAQAMGRRHAGVTGDREAQQPKRGMRHARTPLCARRRPDQKERYFAWGLKAYEMRMGAFELR